MVVIFLATLRKLFDVFDSCCFEIVEMGFFIPFNLCSFFSHCASGIKYGSYVVFLFDVKVGSWPFALSLSLSLLNFPIGMAFCS